MIEFKNASKSFVNKSYKKTLFRKLSFKIQQGEMIAITGKSGSGKTTLLNILGGIELLSEGEYSFKHQMVTKFNNKELLEFRRKNISYVFQNYALIPEYTVIDNILLPVLYKYGNKKKYIERVKTILKELEIDYLIDQDIKYLSGGEKQRIAIARALITNNDVILADEPTGSVDDENSKGIMKLFKKMNEQGKTIIIVTHDSKIAELCDRIIEI